MPEPATQRSSRRVHVRRCSLPNRPTSFQHDKLHRDAQDDDEPQRCANKQIRAGRSGNHATVSTSLLRSACVAVSHATEWTRYNFRDASAHPDPTPPRLERVRSTLCDRERSKPIRRGEDGAECDNSAGDSAPLEGLLEQN